MSSTSKYGSIWRKWDLHVHSPASALNNQFEGKTFDERWKNYLDALGEIEDISVLGITDYFSIEGYKRVRQEKKYNDRLTKVSLVIPNIELRIIPVTAEDSAINIHVLADPDIVDELDRVLFSKLTFGYKGEEYRCVRDDLIKLGRKVEGNESLEEQVAYKNGVMQFKVTHTKIQSLYATSKVLRDHSIIVVPNRSGDGNSGRQEGSMEATRQEIYRLSHAIFSSNENDRLYFLGQGADPREVVIERCGSLKPCIHGSDAHQLDDIGKPDLERYTWIKADATFEGLKQICYEPEHRVQIREKAPIEPVHRIICARLAFPEDAMIEANEFTDHFCLRGEHTLYFSPGFTCLIGGRGTGKSTVLNLLKEGLGRRSSFFEDNLVTTGAGPVDLEQAVTVETSGRVSDIEFLSQNEVEEFAVDHQRFTDAIYTRLRRFDIEDELEEAEVSLQAYIGRLERLIEAIATEQAIVEELKTLRQEHEADRKIVESLKDEVYITLTTSAKTFTEQLTNVRDSRLRLRNLLEKLVGIVDEQPGIDEERSNVFESKRKLLIAAIEKATEEARSGIELEKPSESEEDLQTKIADIEAELGDYLQERDISEENIRDISQASSRAAELQSRIEGKERELAQTRKLQGQLTVEAPSREKFENALVNLIEPLNDQLQEMQGEVSRISLAYRFNSSRATQVVVEHLADQVSEMTDGPRQRIDFISAVLDHVNLEDLPERDALMGQIAESEGGSKTIQIVSDYFRNEYRYRCFRVFAQRTFSDVTRFKQIRVSYDGKPLKNASFGQRCTAAIIVLLLLGNNPIVIDEPEAHLDSALIAGLLVDMIKNIKTNRQIIFATHNANFVVNGDAGLVHVLRIGDDKSTEITSTTLENKEYREDIIALEGGEAAFELREQRYGMKNVLK